MKTAGVVFDIYDDLSGSILKEYFPVAEGLPDMVKEAHLLSPEEHEVLRNEAYALVMADEGKVMRKFACIDAGNTVLSVLYFEKTAEKLPVEAVQVAAQNLCSFCEDFGIEPTNFLKMASKGASRTRDPMMQPLVGDEADWAARTNLVSVRGGADSGKVVPTASQMKTAAAEEPLAGGESEYKPGTIGKAVRVGGAVAGGLAGGRIANTNIGRLSTGMSIALPARVVATLLNRGGHHHAALVADSMGEAARLAIPMYLGAKAGYHGVKKLQEVGHKKGAEERRWIANTIRANPSSTDAEKEWIKDNDPTTKVSTIVDVSAKEPIPMVEKRASINTAVDGKYSLDSYADVKKAVEYFNENWPSIDVEDRHEYCVKTAARADQLGVEIDALMERYGSTSYAPDVEAHLANRKANVEAEFHELFDSLKEKRASIHPEDFAQLLAQADIVSGLNWSWGGAVSDPWLATFGGETEKQAESAWNWKSDLGEVVNATQLKKLALSGRAHLTAKFSGDMVDAFQKDPVAIFESMPQTHKALIAKMAIDGEFSNV